MESIWLVCPARLNRKSCPFTNVFHAVGIADVGNIDFEAGFVTANVCRIPAILGDKAVDERNGSAFLKKADARLEPMNPNPPVMSTCAPE